MPGPEVEVIARAPAQPAPKTMPGSGQLVLGLHDRDVALAALRVDAVAVAVLNEVFAERRRWRDRIPGGDRAAAHHAAERRGAISLHEHQALGLSAHRHEAPRIVLLEVLARVLEADVDRRHIELDRRRLAAELRAQALLDGRRRNLEQLREHADVDHVHQVLAQVALIGEMLLRERRERNGVVAEVFAQRIALARKALFVDRPRRPT